MKRKKAKIEEDAKCRIYLKRVHYQKKKKLTDFDV